MLSRDDGISCSFCPLRAQAETLVTSEAAHPSAGPGQPASPPRKVDANQRILRAEGGWLPGHPTLAASNPSFPCKESDLRVYLLLKTQSLALNPLLFFGSCLKPLPPPSSCDYLC